MEKIVCIGERSWQRLLERVEHLSALAQRLEEVCRALNITKRTLQSYRDRGAIPCSRLDGKFYYRRRDLAAWLSHKTVQTR